MDQLPTYFAQAIVVGLGGGSAAFSLDAFFPSPAPINCTSALIVTGIEVATQITVDLVLMGLLIDWYASSDQDTSMIPLIGSIVIPFAQPNLLKKTTELYNGIRNLMNGSKYPDQIPYEFLSGPFKRGSCKTCSKGTDYKTDNSRNTVLEDNAMDDLRNPIIHDAY